MNRKELILGNVRDLVADFLYYDRHDDEDLPRGEIEDAIGVGEVSIEEIVKVFEKELRDAEKAYRED